MFEAAMLQLEARIADRSPRSDRGWIFVQRDQSAMLTQLFQNQAAMSSAPERAVHIDAVRLYLQRFNCFVQQDGRVGQVPAHKGLRTTSRAQLRQGEKWRETGTYI